MADLGEEPRGPPPHLPCLGLERKQNWALPLDQGLDLALNTVESVKTKLLDVIFARW